jgi:thymidine phosphorylase
MGGGRFTPGETIDPSVGIAFHKKRGDEVSRGERVLDLHASNEETAAAAARRLAGAVRVSPEPPERVSLFL